ncbi:hypothetical protein GE09DRAFT_714986 [Coniochaeta sp. 2T2.1]|nr:hypothetical protein GE09DRAFT_714986 [Coniochaeta sp. 2T2.1]
MDSPRPQVDLEKELTCSICTELLYQPLTLLDCLHTFCGACLKEWFSWQALAAESAPSPPADLNSVYTCPSCRAAVRDTRHNATVATLLEMFLLANPEKGKSPAEMEEMDGKYRPGEKVLRKLEVAERSEEERRLEREERRLIESVREMSLREAVAGGAGRRRDGSGEGSARARRQAERETDRSALRVEGGGDGGSGRRRSTSRQTRGDESPGRRERRHIEHQSSIRSLISTGDDRNMTQSEVDHEIEDFARQIQEEGLLEGLDLDNLDLSNNDELSRKITEAYRRRQRQRSRHEAGRRSNASATPSMHHSDPDNASSSRLGMSNRQGRSRSSSQTGQAGGQAERTTRDRSRPPTSSGTARLEVQTTRPRRRTASGGRSATVPVGIAQPEARVAARSQTDLSLRTNTSEVSSSSRPSMSNEGRSTSTPTMTTAVGSISNSPTTHSMPFSARAAAASTGLGIHHPSQPSTSAQPAPLNTTTRPRPTQILTSPTFPAHPDPLSPAISPLLTPSTTVPGQGHKRTRSQLYPEPSITCKRCQRPHIEYSLHYNCSTCYSGSYNICLSCYRRGKGCLHWFGFGYGAWRSWEKARLQQPDLAKPHMLTANRYRRPKILPGGAEGRVTLTNQNPELRLESGTFCCRCERWTTREVYWRCEGCNEGDWGFCSECVDTGRGCAGHLLLPLTYVAPPPVEHVELEGSSSASAPPSPGLHPGGVVGDRTGRVTVQTGGEGASIGPFRRVVVNTRCEVCRRDVAPREERLHCYACSSGLGAETRPGEWEVCEGCYVRLEGEGRISPENGTKGWRRCLAGHRLAIVAFVEGKDGVLRRKVVRDWVGGRKLGFEEYAPGLQVCFWMDNGVRKERLVTRDVAATAETDVGVRGTRWTDEFPADGGSGGRAVARWAWYPAEGAEDELLFPKGAQVREIEDVNGEWFHGVYMGAKGLFPAPYVFQLSDGN